MLHGGKACHAMLFALGIPQLAAKLHCAVCRLHDITIYNVQYVLHTCRNLVVSAGVEPVAALLPTVMATAVSTLTRVIADAEKQQPKLSIISPELVPEASAALSLLSVLQRVYDASGAQPPPELQAGVNAAASLAAFDFGGGSMRLPGKAISIIEACFELATRAVFRDVSSLGVIFNSIPEVQNRWDTN